MSPEERASLEEIGVDRPRQLLRLARREAGRELARGAVGRDSADFRDLLRHVRLCAHKGIGAVYGWQLGEVGVHSVAGLRDEDPVQLHARLAAAHDHPPRLDMVRVWILASRQPGIVQRTAEP